MWPRRLDDFFRIDRNRREIKNRLAHLHRRPANFAVIRFQIDPQHPPPRFHSQRIIPRQPMVVRVLRHAAHTVPAHLPFRAIDIEHAHAHIRLVRWQNQNQPIRPNPKMPIGHSTRQRTRIRNFLAEPVNVNVVVTEPMHFCELHNDID